MDRLSSTALPLPVRYTALYGGILLLAGTFMVVVGLAVRRPLLLVLGALNLGLGALAWLKPAYVVHSDRIEVKNLLGMTFREHLFGSLSRLEIRGSSVYRRDTGERLSGLVKIFARGSDWRRLVSLITAEPH